MVSTWFYYNKMQLSGIKCHKTLPLWFDDRRVVSWLNLVNFYDITHAVVWSCHVSFPTMLNAIPAVQTLDSSIHWINHYPVDKCYENQLCYPLVRVLISW